MNMEGLNNLEAYQSAQNLAVYVYKNVLNELPNEEKWGLISQIRRAAASIPANIAEGYGRYYYQETIRFCYIARGSLLELMSHLELSMKLGYLSNEALEIIEQQASATLKLIHGFINYLKRSKRGQNEPGAQIAEPEPIFHTDREIVLDEGD